MMRFSQPLALALILALSPLAGAQSETHQSLAERIGSLREGWSFSSDQDDQPKAPLSTPERIALRNKSTAGVTDMPTVFPRVNPKELLPRNWFGVETKENPRLATDRSAAASHPNHQATAPAASGPQAAPEAVGGSVGSARARLLRDMRRSPVAAAEATPTLAQEHPQPRAGSVLSPGAVMPQPTPSQRSAASSRVARSIAAEVADAMAKSPAEPAEPTILEESASEEPTFAETPRKESLLPFGDIVGMTPTDEPANESTEEPTEEPFAFDEEEGSQDAEPDASSDDGSDEEPQFAENASGRIGVATPNEEPTTLPLLIGERYSESTDQTTIAPTETAETSDPAAAEAFANGPTDAEVASAKRSEQKALDEDDLLLTQRVPVLVSQVNGPRTITVGREVSYRVLLANRGEVGADQVVTSVSIPEWADVVGSDAATGLIEQQASMSDGGLLVWKCDHLAAGETTRLNLKLIARSGQPIELGVTHTHQPIDDRTFVEVQEPKLALTLVGPEEVLYGKPQLFRLTLSNPGTGVAQRVKLMLTPPGGNPDRQTSHDFGSIGAGEERSVEIELTAREAGELAVNASATAEGDVSAEVSKQVFCRKAELVVDWRGPSERYAGTPSVYYFRVRNPGTAVAPDVVLNVQLPDSFEVLPGADSPKVQNGKLAFQAGSLRAGDDKFFELRGILRKAGTNEIALSAAASDETRSNQLTAKTEVVALADLQLDVLDPKGPVATGQEIAYEIRITNRGSNEARDIRVVGLFSAGIEPHHIEGGESHLHDGRVAFEAIDVLAAGEQKTFTIHARGHQPGTHRFRAEVLCRDLEIKLAAEETTRFFKDESVSVASEAYPSQSGSPTLFPR